MGFAILVVDSSAGQNWACGSHLLYNKLKMSVSAYVACRSGTAADARLTPASDCCFER